MSRLRWPVDPRAPLEALRRWRDQLRLSGELPAVQDARSRAEQTTVGRIAGNYLSDDVDGLAGMLAYNALFSLMPVLLLIGLTIGVLVQNAALRDDVSQIVTEDLPPALSDPVIETVDAAANNRESLGIITIVSLLFGGSRLYGALDRSFAVVYRSRRRGFLQRRLFATLIVPALVLILVASTVISAAATSFLATSLNRYVDISPSIQEFVSVYVVGFLLVFAMTLIAYAAIPVNGSGWRGSIPGAAVAALLFVLLSQLYPLYIRVTGGFNSYGAAVGLVLLFMFWLYLAAQIIIIGAEINAVTSGARQRNVAAGSLDENANIQRA